MENRPQQTTTTTTKDDVQVLVDTSFAEQTVQPLLERANKLTRTMAKNRG